MKKLMLILIILIMAFMFSWKGDDAGGDDDDILGGPGVYTAGSYITDSTGNESSCYWKNCVRYDALSASYNMAESIFVAE